MSLPNVILLGFGTADAMVQHGMNEAAAQGLSVRYVGLEGHFPALARPNPAFWQNLKEQLEGEDDSLVIWAQDGLVLWDKLARALMVNHRPDFLWPLPLTLAGGNVVPTDTRLYRAIGGFEMSLYNFNTLHSFHHAVTARALAKLLTVEDLSQLTFMHYLHSAWVNFESVKAPDTWMIHDAASSLIFEKCGAKETLDHSSAEYKKKFKQWQMGREGLNAQSANTLAAAEFLRSNADIMEPYLPDLSANLPYYGFWPVRAAGGVSLNVPCHGYHPVVTSHIWLGDYHPLARDVWSKLFCNGIYNTVIDTRTDGHLFGLLYLLQSAQGNALLAGHNIVNIARAQSCAEVNNLATPRLRFVDEIPVQKDALTLVHAPQITEAIWGKTDLFIPIDEAGDIALLQKKSLPADYHLYACEMHKPHIHHVAQPDALPPSTAVMLLHKDRATQVIGKAAS